MKKYTAQQRAGLAVLMVYNSGGEPVPTADIAKFVGVKRRAALAMMRKLEQVVPIQLEYYGWWWAGKECVVSENCQ